MVNYDPILYGHSNTPNIVAVEPVDGRSMVEVFVRNSEGITKTLEPAMPFMFVNDRNPMLNLLYGVDMFRLRGNQYYNVLVQSADRAQMNRYINEVSDRVTQFDLATTYLIRSGNTLFKDMDFNDPLVLAVDIETLTFDKAFSDAKDQRDEIIIITMADNRGNEWILNTGEAAWEFSDEASMLSNFVQMIHTIDPDIIIGHNIFGFDIPYIKTRCEIHNVPFSLGRNNTEPTYKHRIKKFADKRREYDEPIVYGRQMLDTELLAREVDAVSRKFDSYGLKSLIKSMGLASENREYVEGKDITPTWFYDKDKLLRYAIDDVRETIQLYNSFAGSLFASTQFLPMNMQTVFQRGTGGKIESMFMRYYLAKGHSWPKPEEKREYSGGYADILEFGLIEGPLVYADVDSLYPSLAEVLHIQPKRDELHFFQKLLHVLKAKRFELKNLIKTDPDNKAKHKATDGGVKVYLNTMAYGFIGWEHGAFNDYGEAERITTNGRMILHTMMDLTDLFGGRSVKVDTDGALMTLPPGYTADQWCSFLSDQMIKGINISNDGEYTRAILFDKKSYILVGNDGEITMKGNTLKGRSIEHFGQEFINDCVKAILDGHKERIKRLYAVRVDMIKKMQLSAEDIVVKKDLKISVREYQEKLLREKNFNAQAQYEVAIRSGKDFTVGDAVAYYVKQAPMETVLVRGKEVTRPARLRSHEKAEHIDNYAHDYDVDHYLDRLTTHLKRFMALYTPEEFTSTFDVKLYAADRRKYKQIYDSYEQ